MTRSWRALALAMSLASMAAPASAATIQITEWMYNGLVGGAAAAGEFVELTNMGSSTVDFTGWSFDDNSRAPGSQSLSAFGLVAPGESVILTDDTAANFRANWGLAASIKVIGGNTNNLGRSDEINIYDATNTLIDRLTYNDQGTGSVAGPRTQNVSGRPGSAAALGANNASLWVLSTVGDADHARLSLLGEIGSPGFTALAPVPLPAGLGLLLGGLGLLRVAGGRRT